MERQYARTESLAAVALAVAIAVALYVSSVFGYLLFHSLIEITTVAVSFALFMLTWNASRYFANTYLRALGIGYGCIALVDLLHTLAYKGMNVFPEHGANYATQLWIAARYLQAVLLLAAPALIKRRIPNSVLLATGSAAVGLMIAWIRSGAFPDCYIEGHGLTSFKIGSEYVIMALLFAALLALRTQRSHFDPGVYTLLACSIACTVISEASFTAYVSVYGFANLLGHYAKLAAFYLVYRSVLVTGISQPFALIFRDFKEAEAALRRSEGDLENKVRARTAELRASETSLRQRNRELRAVSKCNEVMMRAEDEPTLLHDVCRIVCDEAGYRMVFVGYAEQDEGRTVRPVAWAGTDAGYLGEAKLTWHDTERGRGPAGLAIRGGRPAAIQDFAGEPAAAPWRADALQRGYRSSIALPLKDELDRTFGVLGIYSDEPGTFTPGETRLLEELASDLAFGLTVLRTREQHRQAQEEIRRLNQELEQRVTERTSQLEAANKELEAFAYSVSHDLRAPLRHIDGFVSLLKDEEITTAHAKSQRYMDTISEASHRMGTLIDDLLAFSRLGRAPATHESVDLRGLVDDVLQELQPDTRGRDITWRIGPLPVVTGDRAMLRIALMNLVANAVKFTRPRARAEIEIGVQAGGGPETVVYIKDNGVGFDMKYANKLFGVFQRLHAATEFEGTGIGLANVRRVITRHGGRTWAEGKVGEGATFYVSLPRRATRVAEQHVEAAGQVG